MKKIVVFIFLIKKKYSEFIKAKENPDYKPIFDKINESKKLLEATWNRNEKKKVAELLEKAHNKSNNKKYNDENTLEQAIKDAYIYARVYYTVLSEVDSGKGYADVTYFPINPEKPAMIIELKYNKTAKSGIKQIKEKNYPARLEHYKKNFF